MIVRVRGWVAVRDGSYLSSQALAAPQQMSPSLLLSQSRLNLFTHHMRYCRTPNSFPSMTWLGLACPDLAADRCPKLKITYVPTGCSITPCSALSQASCRSPDDM
jgi:hypothetical protein